MQKIYIVWAWLFGRPFFYYFNEKLFSLAIRGMGIFNYTSPTISGEKWLINNFVKKLGKNLIIFDVGANVGDYSKLLINSEVSISRIFAFEPHPKTFKRLKQNLIENSVLDPVQSALSEIAGNMILFDREDCDGSSKASLAESIFSEVYQVGSSERSVKVDTIDFFCESNEIKSIDFLKIDVEGYELNVLKGARNMLNNKKIRMVQFEFTQLNSSIGVFFKKIYDLLSGDYVIYRMLSHGVKEIKNYDPITCELFGFQNFVAVLKAEEIS